MKKSLKLIILTVSLVLATLFSTACDDGASTGNEDNVTVPEKNKEKEKRESERGNRSDPIDQGESTEWELFFYSSDDIDDWEELTGLANVTLNEVYERDDAVAMLYPGVNALEEIEEGYTYAVAHMTVELIEGEEDFPYTTGFTVNSVSEKGRKSPATYTSLSREYSENKNTDLYPGGSVDIMDTFLIPIDDDYLIEIEEIMSGSKFFKSEVEAEEE